MSTTGTKIVAAESVGLIIAEDVGWYSGTIQEYNIRRLRQLHELNLSLMNPVFNDIANRGEGYGGGWGDIGILYPVSDDDIAKLLEENEKAIAAHIKLEAAEDAAAKEWQQTVGTHICPNCHTFCYGDCSTD